MSNTACIRTIISLLLEFFFALLANHSPNEAGASLDLCIKTTTINVHAVIAYAIIHQFEFQFSRKSFIKASIE